MVVISAVIVPLLDSEALAFHNTNPFVSYIAVDGVLLLGLLLEHFAANVCSWYSPLSPAAPRSESHLFCG